MAAQVRITDRDDWFEIWFSDKESMIEVMVKNMASDLENGYDYFGKSIRQQREMIDTYKAKFDEEIEHLKTLDDRQINRWCFIDLKKRGAI